MRGDCRDLSYWRFSERNFTLDFCTPLTSSLVPLQRFNASPLNDCIRSIPISLTATSRLFRPCRSSQSLHSTLQRPRSDFLAIRSMSAIGIICHWSLAPPAATRFPSSIIIAVIVLPHRGQFRRGPLMRNTCNKSSWPWWG